MSGSAIPRFAPPETDRLSLGPALVATAEVLGFELMPWQRHVVNIALEHDDAGQLAYRDVVVSTPRQSGKSVLVLAAIVHRMLSAPRQRIVYGAQSRLSARIRLFDVWWPRIARSPLRELFSLSRATGTETLRAVNGSVMMLLSTEESSIHGESLDAAYVDECWSLPSSVEQSIRPTMSTRPSAQAWWLSTAGTERSTFWREKIDAGRAAAEAGVTETTAYFEWSAGDDIDVSDPETWPGFMPALHRTIWPQTVQADLAAMPTHEWARAYANRWPDESDQGWRVIPRDVWMAARL